MDDLQEKFEDNPPAATSIVVFTDSLSALQAMEEGDLNEELIKVLHTAEKLSSTYQVKLVLQWIPGHTGIYGNEKADILAKKGSQTLQPSKPITLQTAKQRLKQTYRREWMNNWASGSTARKVFEHMKKTQPQDNLKLLKRKDQPTIFRLRTQHVPLNLHLNRFNPEKPPHCVLCDHAYESVEHVSFHCPATTYEISLYLPTNPNIQNTLYCSRDQLENTASFYHMTCVKRANAQRHLD